MHLPQTTELCCICCGHFMSPPPPPSHGFGALQKSMTVLFLDILRLFVIQKFLLHWGDKTPTPTREHWNICTLFQLFLDSNVLSILLVTARPRRFLSTDFCNSCVFPLIYSKHHVPLPSFLYYTDSITPFSFGEFIFCLPLLSPEYGCDTWICSPSASGFSLFACLSVCLKTDQPSSHPRTTCAHLRCLPAFLV